MARIVTGFRVTCSLARWQAAAALAAAILLVTLAACGDGGLIGPRPPAPTLSLAIDKPFVGPREQTRITIEVVPTTGDPIVEGWLRLMTGNARDSLALPFFGDEPQGAFADLTIAVAPVSAVIAVAATVRTRRGASAEASGAFTIGDTTPPRVRWVNVDDTVRAGQTAFVSAWYEDLSGLVRTELRLRGAMVRDDVFDLQGFPTEGSIAFQITVPERPGDSIVQTAAGVDMYGLRREIRQVYHITPTP